MVVLNKAKFYRYIEAGVNDHRLTLLQPLKVISKPCVNIDIHSNEERTKLKTNDHVFGRRDSFKQTNLSNWFKVREQPVCIKKKKKQVYKQMSLQNWWVYK